MTKYTLKPGVFGTPKPELASALDTAADVYHGWRYALVVTSLADGVHMQGSLHPRGYAADLRSSVLGNDLPCICRQLRKRLGKKYEVIVEGTHIHVEFDPNHDGGKGLS